MNFGMLISTSLLTLTISISAAAMNFDGLVSTLNLKRSITLESSGKKYYLVPDNQEIAIQINKLKVNDFISLEGKIDDKAATVSVRSMNYVGLKDLLGNWVGDDDYCYTFSTFSSLSIFTKNTSNKCDFKVDRLSRDFSYTINPATTSWLVLLSDNEESYIMDLVVRSKASAELSLYDTRSGDILKEIKLRR